MEHSERDLLCQSCYCCSDTYPNKFSDPSAHTLYVRISHEEGELRDGGGMPVECSVDDMRSFYYLR